MWVIPRFTFEYLGGGRETGEPAMVLARFEYLRSKRKLLTAQLESPDMFENLPRLPTGREECVLLKIGAKSFRCGSQDICKDTESNLGPFASF